MSFDKFPHIDNLYKVPDIFTADEVVCTEKIHGCNFRVQLEQVYPGDWKITYGSRNHEVQLGSNFYGDKPVRWFTDGIGRIGQLITAAHKLAQGDGTPVTIYGEIFGSSIQGGVRYLPAERDGEVEFRAFDVKLGDTFLGWYDFLTFCRMAELPHVPALYIGPPKLECLNELLEQRSFVGDLEEVRASAEQPNISEGVVIKPTDEMKNSHGDRLIAKHKSEGFAEKSATKRPAIEPRWPNLALQLAGQYVTRGRVLNAIEKAESDASCLRPPFKVDGMSAMKFLPAIVYQDILPDLEETCDPKTLFSAVTRQTGIELKKILNERIGQ